MNEYIESMVKLGAKLASDESKERQMILGTSHFEKMSLREIKALLKKRTSEKNNDYLYRVAFTETAKKNKTPCARCGRTEMQTCDHIVPASLCDQLGVDMDSELDEENFQVLCRPCNQYKANRLDFSIPKTKELLLKYINKLK
jgi:hypothetical protein